jgi:acyl-CoA thioesterase I
MRPQSRGKLREEADVLLYRNSGPSIFPPRFYLLFILFSLLLISGCTSVPQLPPLPADGVVLAFGDSITHGTGAGPAESYPAVLAQLIGRKVVNGGVPGEVSAAGAARLPEILEAERPVLLILCHGGNDMLQRLDRGALAANLRTMVRAARERGVAVVLVGVPAADLSLTPPSLYGEVAKEFGLPYDGDTLPRILGKGSLKSDYIHPNAAGYRRLAESLAKLLAKAGAI